MTTVSIAQHLIGESAPMRHLRSLISRVAGSTIPVLVEGETGAGKELVARALHQSSGRRGDLIAFNVCAIADTMFEDALFGHVRGAYTGAVQNSAGYLAEANGGTLFLDEIGGLPLASQAKLLRAIETKEFRPVGARADQRSDFRLIAASNEDMTRLVERGQFRRDLAHRLGAMRVAVPPLRERLEDVPILAAHFAAHAKSGHATDTVLGIDVIRALQAHSWPGNVRELRHVVEASIALSSGMVREEDVSALIQRDVSGPTQMRLAHQGRDLLDQLDRCAWDVNEVASELGVHRTTVYRRLRRLGISEPGVREAPVLGGS